MTARACLDCGETTQAGSRCSACERGHKLGPGGERAAGPRDAVLGVATEPAGARRAVGNGRGRPAFEDEGWGSRNCGRADLLGGLLECVCGQRVRSDGTFADGRHRKLHPGPCAKWGSKARLADATWEAPILAQVAGIELDNSTIAQVVAVLGSTRRPVAIDRARFERQMRDLALEHAAGGLVDATYLARMSELRGQLAAVDEGSNAGVSAERAVAWLRALGETWHHADVPQAKADLLHAIYERIVVAGPTFVSVRLTPAAYAHGLALALPQVVRARPTGVGREIATYSIPIEGRDEWLAAARRLA